MNQRLKLIDYYQRFYTLTIEPLLPTTSSQWSYFTLLLRHPHFQFSRVEQYLSILQQEKQIKKQFKPYKEMPELRMKRQQTMPSEKKILEISKRVETEYSEPTITAFHRRTESVEEKVGKLEKEIVNGKTEANTLTVGGKIKFKKGQQGNNSNIRRVMMEAVDRLLGVFEETQLSMR